MKNSLILLVICTSMLCSNMAMAQDAKLIADSVLNFPSSYFSKVENKYEELEDKVTKQTEKYLQKLFSREKKMQRKLAKIDSTGAKQLFANAEKEYTQMLTKVKSAGNKLSGKSGGYIPMLDSVKTSLSFLEQNSKLLGQSKEIQEKLKGSL